MTYKFNSDFVEQSKNFNNGLRNFFEVAAEALSTAFQEIGLMLEEAYNCFYQEYLEAGAPYGETQEGMSRWYSEKSKAKRLRAEADRILNHHQMLADFRRKINEKRKTRT